MNSKQQSPAIDFAHRIADDLERRLKPFAEAPKKRAAARKKDAAPEASGLAALLAPSAPDREDEERVLRALAGQTAAVREAMAADLERLMSVAREHGAPE